jgi:hypothetical protein
MSDSQTFFPGQKIKISVNAKDWSKEGAPDDQHWTHANCAFIITTEGGGLVQGTPIQMTDANQALEWTVTVPKDAAAGAPCEIGVFYCSASGERTRESTNVLAPDKGVCLQGNIFKFVPGVQ